MEEYETLDEGNTGEISLRMQTSSFREEANIQLNKYMLKNICKEYDCNSIALRNLHKSMTDRLSAKKSQVKDAKLSLQQAHSKMIQRFKYVLNNVGKTSLFTGLQNNRMICFSQTEDESIILAKYGNMWIRNTNNKIILGIPVYNCSFER